MRRICAAIIAMVLLTLGSAGIGVGVEFVTTYPVGPQPFAVVSDPHDGRLYVANSGIRTPSGGGMLSVVDPVSGNTRFVETSKTSNLLALDSGARRLYSSNGDPTGTAKSLDVFDVDSGTLVQSFAGIGGLGVALDETRSRVYASSGSFLVSLDTTTFDMNVASAPFGQAWFGVAVDRSLGRVYVANISFPSPSLVVLNANTLQVVANLSLPTSARFALAVDEATHRVFVGGNNENSNAWTISVVDGTTFALTTVPFSTFPSGIVHDAAGHRIWVTGVGGQFGSPPSTLTALDDATLAVQSETTLPWSPSLAAFGRDGRLYVSGWSAGVLGAFDVNEPANAPPVIDAVTVTPPLPATNDTLTAVVAAHDPDGDPVTLTYVWRVNGRLLAETSPSLDLSNAGNGDRNDSVCLTVTASNDHPIPATATWCQGVRDSAPQATVSLDSANPATDAVLHANATATDADGDTLYYEFTWMVNGLAVRTTYGASTTDQLDLSQPGRGDKGDVVSVAVVVFDGLMHSDAVTASAAVANSAPTVTLTLSDRNPWKHDVLGAMAAGVDRDGDVLNYVFKWFVNDVLTYTTDHTASATFDLDAFAVPNRATVIVEVTATDGGSSATARATAIVTPPGQ